MPCRFALAFTNCAIQSAGEWPSCGCWLITCRVSFCVELEILLYLSLLWTACPVQTAPGASTRMWQFVCLLIEQFELQGAVCTAEQLSAPDQHCLACSKDMVAAPQQSHLRQWGTDCHLSFRQHAPVVLWTTTPTRQPLPSHLLPASTGCKRQGNLLSLWCWLT